MRCLPGSNDCALPYYRKAPYASTIPPPIFIESNACCNFNVKLTPAAAEWSETMPRLPAERLHVSRKGIPKHCLVRRAYRAEYVRSRSRTAKPASARIRPGAPGSGAAPPALSLMSAQPVRSARLRRSPGSARAGGVKGDPQVERSGP